MRTELKVGLLVLSATLVLFYMVSRLTQGTFSFGQAGATYYTTAENAAGLSPRSKIHVAGIAVGEIKEIKLEGNRARIVMELDRDLEIHTDAKAQLRSLGYLGDRYISLLPGSPGKPELKEGSFIPLTSSLGDLGALTEQGGELMQNLNTLLEQLNQTLFGIPPGAPAQTQRDAPEERPEASGSAQAEDSQPGTTDSSAQAAPVRRNRIPQEGAALSSGVNRAPAQTGSASARPKAGGAQGGVMGQAQDQQNRLDRVLRNLERFSREVARIRNLDELTKQLYEISKNLEEITTHVRSGQGTIGRLVYDEETSDRVQMTISGVNRMMTEVDGTKIFLDAKGAWLTEGDDAMSEFNLELRSPSANRVLIGATHRSDPLLEAGESEGGNLAFDAQLARSFGRWAARVGFFESTGGLGLEYWWSPRERIYTEAYRFGADGLPVQLNAGAELLLFGPVGAWVGGDYLTSDRLRSFFVGLRVNWTLVDIALGG